MKVAINRVRKKSHEKWSKPLSAKTPFGGAPKAKQLRPKPNRRAPLLPESWPQAPRSQKLLAADAARWSTPAARRFSIQAALKHVGTSPESRKFIVPSGLTVSEQLGLCRAADLRCRPPSFAAAFGTVTFAAHFDHACDSLRRLPARLCVPANAEVFWKPVRVSQRRRRRR
jgi:hypothetical protein